MQIIHIGDQNLTLSIAKNNTETQVLFNWHQFFHAPFTLQDPQGNGQFTNDSQGYILTTDGDPRTGTFPQTQVTAGDTTCSVNGVSAVVFLIQF